MAGDEGPKQTVEVGLILGIAKALRAEFGVGIDVHPGGPGADSGVVNRAFQVAARPILRSIVPKDEDLDCALTSVLRLAALRRLAEVGVVGRRAEDLLDQEPGLGDAWLAYLALAPGEVVGEIMGEGPACEADC